MKIDLAPFMQTFCVKPLLFGGQAMEHYGLRKAGNDVDLLLPHQEYRHLSATYPQNVITSSLGEPGLALGIYEFWATSCGYIYDELVDGAQEMETYLVISLENLLFLKALSMDQPKSARPYRVLCKDSRPKEDNLRR